MEYYIQKGTSDTIKHCMLSEKKPYSKSHMLCESFIWHSCKRKLKVIKTARKGIQVLEWWEGLITKGHGKSVGQHFPLQHYESEWRTCDIHFSHSASDFFLSLGISYFVNSGWSQRWQVTPNRSWRYWFCLFHTFLQCGQGYTSSISLDATAHISNSGSSDTKGVEGQRSFCVHWK